MRSPESSVISTTGRHPLGSLLAPQTRHPRQSDHQMAFRLNRSADPDSLLMRRRPPVEPPGWQEAFFAFHLARGRSRDLQIPSASFGSVRSVETIEPNAKPIILYRVRNQNRLALISLSRWRGGLAGARVDRVNAPNLANLPCHPDGQANSTIPWIHQITHSRIGGIRAKPKNQDFRLEDDGSDSPHIIDCARFPELRADCEDFDLTPHGRAWAPARRYCLRCPFHVFQLLLDRAIPGC